MIKLRHSSAVLLSVFSLSVYAEPDLLLERLNKEHIISAEPNSPFTVDRGAAGEVVVPSPLAPVKLPAPTPDLSERHIKQLKDQLAALQHEIKTLRKKQAAAIVKPGEASGEGDNQRQQLHALSQQLAQANKSGDALNSQLDAAMKKMSMQASRIEKLEEALKQSSEEKAQAKQQLNTVQATPRPQDAEQLQSMSNDNKVLQQQLAEAKEQAAASEEKRQLATAKTAELEKQLAEANKTREAADAQLADATKQTTGQSAQLAELEAKLKQRSEENTLAQQQLAELEAKLKQSSEQKAQVEQQLAAAQATPAVAKTAATKAASPAFSLAANKSEHARVNYAWGVWFAAKVQLESEVLKDIGQKFMPAAFLQGLQDKFANTLQMQNAELEKILSTLNKQVDDARQREITRNKKQGQQLLADAAKLKGAVRADNGVVYLVEKRGPGAAIGDTDVIRFKVDEKVSSGQVLAQNEVNTARVSELPMVMRAGVKKLVVGGRVKIYVPTELAYGEEGIPGAVPPGVTSVMTLEVLGIEK